MTQTVLSCALCGKKGARVRRVIRSYGRGSNEFLVRNIPMVACRQCGESYATARTLHELERIRANHRELAVKQRIAVARFADPPNRGAS